MVHLQRGARGTCHLRGGATIALSEAAIKPSFDEPNIADRGELLGALNELAASSGLQRQKRWSLTLPEATTRTVILTLESRPASSRELEEVLTWKMERGFGVSLESLSISRERLLPDAQGRDRYLVVAVRSDVLGEYESVLNWLGWRAGLILPRHMGEAQWLTRNGATGDALLISSSDNGFTAVVFRGKQPLILRNVTCQPEECEDELYRLLLFYRERRKVKGERHSLSRLLVIGEGIAKDRVQEIITETLGSDLRALQAADLGLELPTRDLSFDALAAPAGLATLSLQ